MVHIKTYIYMLYEYGSYSNMVHMLCTYLFLVTFLDFNVNLENGLITSDLHTKIADYHQYFYCNSSDLYH